VLKAEAASMLKLKNCNDDGVVVMEGSFLEDVIAEIGGGGDKHRQS
jgi:hypothetical protein